MTSCRRVHPTTSWIGVQRASADISQGEQFIRSISVWVVSKRMRCYIPNHHFKPKSRAIEWLYAGDTFCQHLL